MKRVLAVFSICLFLCLGIFAQMKLSASDSRSNASISSGVIASLGGLRSIAAEVIWFRIDKLQREGRFSELVQLASMLTFLEPHVPEVWSYSAWNLAFNVSFRMKNKADQWYWVNSAIKMLRDEALDWNPGDPDLCYDLAHLFESKVGPARKDLTLGFRDEWREIAQDVARRDAWEELSMNRVEMRNIEKLYGVDDWTSSEASAVYWAHQGLAKADKFNRNRLGRIIKRQAEAFKENRPKKLKENKQ